MKDESVSKLKAALIRKKNEIKSAPKDKVYGMIDKIMSRISKDYDITGKKLHDKWVDEYNTIPDKWIMKEGYKAPKVQPKGALNVFDIDDTLFRSKSRVAIMKDGKVVRYLDSGEFNTYKLKPGEEHDFSEFRSAKNFHTTAVPIDSMISRAQRAVKEHKPGDKTIIITARSDFDDKELFLQKFREHDFPIDNVYVERAGNLEKFKRGAPSHITKGVVLKKYLNTGMFNKIRMWDDHEGNLNILIKIGSLYPDVKIQAFLVDPETGNTTRHK